MCAGGCRSRAPLRRRGTARGGASARFAAGWHGRSREIPGTDTSPLRRHPPRSQLASSGRSIHAPESKLLPAATTTKKSLLTGLKQGQQAGGQARLDGASGREWQAGRKAGTQCSRQTGPAPPPAQLTTHRLCWSTPQLPSPAMLAPAVGGRLSAALRCAWSSRNLQAQAQCGRASGGGGCLRYPASCCVMRCWTACRAPQFATTALALHGPLACLPMH